MREAELAGTLDRKPGAVGRVLRTWRIKIVGIPGDK
jgi:hypothetical protein